MSRYPKELGLQFSCKPGDHLVGYLRENNMTQQEFIKKCGVSAKYVKELISGKVPMTAEAAIQFEKVLGVSADLWLRFEMRHQLKLAYDAEYEAKKKKTKRVSLIPRENLQGEALLEAS